MVFDVPHIVYDKTRGEGSFSIVDMIVEEMKTRKNNPNFITVVLPFLASYRRDLAKGINPSENSLFGVLRDAPPFDRIYRTYLAGPDYSDYNNKWLDRAYALLNVFALKPVSRIEELVQMLESGRTYSVNTYAFGRKWQCRFTVYELSHLPSDLAKIHYINDTLFPLRYLFLHAENFLEIDGSYVSLSQYLVRFDYLKKPATLDPSLLNGIDIQGIEGRLINILPAVVIHQKYDSNHVFYKEIDKIIHLVLNADDSQLIDRFIDLVGLFRYLFAHVCPYCKGNEDIAEWVETALYRYLGFIRTDTDSNSSIELEAMSSLSFEDFLSRYRALLNIQIDFDTCRVGQNLVKRQD